MSTEDDDPLTNSQDSQNGQTSVKSKARLNRLELEIILGWLEDKSNFVSLYRAQKTTMYTPLRSSTKACDSLATTINKQTKSRLGLNGKSIKERIKRHRRLYKKWKDISRSTGFGVTDDDRTKGIFSITSKLEKKCMCFERINKIYGDRPDVTPLGEADSFTTHPQLIINAERDGDGEVDSNSEASDSDSDDGDDNQDREEEVITYRRRRMIESKDDEVAISADAENRYEILDGQIDDWNNHIDITGDAGGVDLLPLSLSIQNEVVAPLDSVTQGEQDATTNAKKKRKRTPGTRKGPLSLSSSNTQSQKASIASVIQAYSLRKAEVLEIVEEKKLEIEIARLDIEQEKAKVELQVRKRQMNLDEQKYSLEEQIRHKQNILEERKVKLEERKVELEIEKERMQLLKYALEKGQTIEQVKQLLELAAAIK
ncbi:hypothetical protein BGZ76_003817 [Entomortierella beljakovae]|nr:hypothetical protein BGZ76_003817 [Entomortierella beljakovae]